MYHASVDNFIKVVTPAIVEIIEWIKLERAMLVDYRKKMIHTFAIKISTFL